MFLFYFTEFVTWCTLSGPYGGRGGGVSFIFVSIHLIVHVLTVLTFFSSFICTMIQLMLVRLVINFTSTVCSWTFEERQRWLISSKVSWFLYNSVFFLLQKINSNQFPYLLTYFLVSSNMPESNKWLGKQPLKLNTSISW